MMKLNEYGRSMIEMLGVLAIVGVLSVGGISGYSRAMNNYKNNVLLSEYVDFFSDVMRHKEEWFREHKKNSPSTYSSDGLYKISGFLDDVLTLPKGWKGEEGVGTGINDSSGSLIYVYARNSVIQFDFFVKRSGEISYGRDKCKLILGKVLKEFADSVEWVALYSNSQRVSDYWYGNQYCTGEENKCYKDMSLNDVITMCNKEVNSDANLAITVKMF